MLVRCQAPDISVTLHHMTSRSLAEVVGAGCQRVRSEIGITQDELARYARDVGLRWNAAKVGDFEAGRSEPAFKTVLAVTLALQWAAEKAGKDRGSGVSPADLVGTDGWVMLTDLNFPAEELAAACRGEAWRFSRADYERGAAEHTNRLRLEVQRDIFGEQALTEAERMLLRSGLAEDRLTRSLGISRSRLADVSFRLWQCTFSEERDRRAGSDANQQKKGRISRELRAELQKALADGND